MAFRSPPKRQVTFDDGEVDDDELSLMSDSEEEEHALPTRLGAFDHNEVCESWADVDVDRMQRIALNIARRAMATFESAETTPLLSLSDETLDVADPLGLVDSNNAQSTTAVSNLRTSASLQEGLLKAIRESEAGGSKASELNPGSKDFDPVKYLATVHAETDLEDLLRGLQHLRDELSEHTTQLKQLVKENFDRFVASKNTIDDVQARLKGIGVQEGVPIQYSADGATPADISEVVLRAQNEAKKTFSSLLERQSRAERIKLTLGLLKRYDALLSLPSSVRTYLDAGDYAGLVVEYGRAKALLAERGAGRKQPPAATSSTSNNQKESSVWDTVLEEVEKVAISAVQLLEALVRSPKAAPNEVQEALKFLSGLAGEGCAAAAKLDAIKAYLSSQKQHVKSLLDAQQQQRILESTPPIHPSTSTRTGRSLPHTDTETTIVQYVATTTAIVSRWLCQFSDVIHVRLLSIQAPRSAVFRHSQYEASLIAEDVLKQWEDVVNEALTNNLLTFTGSFTIVEHIIDANAQVRALSNLPPNLLASFDRVLLSAAVNSIQLLKRHLEDVAQKLVEEEDWGAVAGTPHVGHTGILLHSIIDLRKALDNGMKSLKELREDCSTVGLDLFVDEDHAPHSVLCAVLSSYQRAVSLKADQLVDSTKAGTNTSSNDGGDTAGGNGQSSFSEATLLALFNALFKTRTQELPGVITAWEAFLSSSTQANLKQALKTAAQGMESAEDAIMGTYIERKQAALDTVMEDYFFGGSGGANATAGTNTTSSTALPSSHQQNEVSEWEASPPPTCLRPIALELFASLLNTASELDKLASSVIADALTDLLLGLVEGVSQVADKGLPAGITSGGVLQLWLEMAVLRDAVGRLNTGELSLCFKALETSLQQRLLDIISMLQTEEGGLEELVQWLQIDPSSSTMKSASSLVQECNERIGILAGEEVKRLGVLIQPLKQLCSGDS